MHTYRFKTMIKSYSFVLGIINLLSLIALPICIEGQQPHGSIYEMTLWVQQATLDEFLQAIQHNDWKAPAIYSQWHVEQIAVENERTVMSDNRMFGSRLIERLSEWNKAMTAEVTHEKLQQDIEMFLMLAGRLIESKGYGNLFLAARCHDIATVGIGRLLVDLEYSLDKTRQLVNALQAPWYAPSVREYVLNQEAGVQLFTAVSQEEDAILLSLQETWQAGSLAALEQKASYSERELDEAEQALYELISPIIQQASPLVQEHLDFFVDDELPSPRIITTKSMWERKWHEKLIHGFEPENAQKLYALTTFREAVGYYPTTPSFSEEELRQRETRIQELKEKGIKTVLFEEAFNSLAEAGFAQAWAPHETKETHTLYHRAWRAYEEIISGKFLDEDTRAEMINQQ